MNMKEDMGRIKWGGIAVIEERQKSNRTCIP